MKKHLNRQLNSEQNDEERQGAAGEACQSVDSDSKRAGRGHKWDIILIAGILLCGAIIAAIVLLNGSRGAAVQVLVDGQVTKTFSLYEDTSYEITGTDGGVNLLRIQGGYAWLEDANCPDKLCVNMGRIGRNGQSIVCLPHKVVVEVVAEESDDDVDIVVE